MSSIPPRLPGSDKPPRLGRDGKPLTLRAAWHGMTGTLRMLMMGWWALLLLPSFALFFVLTSQQRHNAEAARERHLARMASPGSCQSDPSRSPPSGREKDVATVVTVGAYVDRVPEISIVTASWKADFFVWFSWEGDLPDPGTTFKVVSGEALSRTLMRKVDTGKQHYSLYKVTAQITKSFDVARFPLDEHVLTIQLEDQALQSYQLCYAADAKASSVSSRVNVPGYGIQGTEVATNLHSYKTSLGEPTVPSDYQGKYSSFLFGIHIKRPSWGMFFKMFSVLYIAVFVALMGLVLRGPNERLALAGTALFVAIGNAAGITPLIPYTGAITLADVIGNIGYLFIGFIIVQSILYHKYFADPEVRQEASYVFDVSSFAILASAFITLNVGVVLAARG